MEMRDDDRWIAESQRCRSYLSAVVAVAVPPVDNSKKRRRPPTSAGERVA